MKQHLSMKPLHIKYYIDVPEILLCTLQRSSKKQPANKLKANNNLVLWKTNTQLRSDSIKKQQSTQHK